LDVNDKALISIVVPAFNEEEVIPAFHERLTTALRALPYALEVVYVNDGSSDKTLPILKQLYDADERVAIVDLSRNFGKEIALTAGLHKARGNAVVVIDADLQDPPELIPQLVKEWENGFDVVYARRMQRSGEGWFKKVSASVFYRLIQKLSRVKIPEDTGDFRLLSRRAVDALNTLMEQNRFMKGLFAWIGYRQKAIYYDRNPRLAGSSKWNYWHLWNFALDGITSFTTAPLKMASYAGFLAAFCAFVYGSFMVVRTIFYGNPVPGYPSLIVVVLFIGGIQLMAIGVVGEYVGRIFSESKRRPLYFVNEYKQPRRSHDIKTSQ
jgi:glycosyltransferase involved in cell wall biosynthesis